MALAFVSEPVGTRTALEAGLGALHATPTPATRAHLAAIGGATSPSPIPVYSIELGDVISGKTSVSSSPVAWCYLLVQGNQLVRIAEVVPDPANRQAAFVFASISANLANDMNQAIEFAENQSAIATGQFEIRMLRASALYIAALWLKSIDDKGDYYVIVPPINGLGTAYVLLTSADFFSVLRNQASQKQRPQPASTHQAPTN